MGELAQVGNRAGAGLALEPTLPCCEVNMYVHQLPIVLFISYHKGTLKTKADILSGVNFISVALKHKQKQ